MKLLIILFFSIFVAFASNFKDINSFEATFKQSIINNSGSEILYSGKIFIKKPFSIVWEYRKPIEKYVYIIDKKATIIEPDLEQAIFSTLDKKINILKLLENAQQISPNQYISTFNNIDYTLTIINNQLEQINYKDSIDNNISISFTNIKQNHTIPNQIFQFTIPNEYDIIRK